MLPRVTEVFSEKMFMLTSKRELDVNQANGTIPRRAINRYNGPEVGVNYGTKIKEEDC